ncbi:MAG: inositol monophosphatase family protein [Ignavibacteriaceae bacterium]
MIDDIIEISKQAGELIREGFGKNFKIEYKTNEINLVTEIDKASEKMITDFIKNKYPGHSILAEESGEYKNKNSDFIWVIDPLDGTTNFAHGLPIFSVSIGVQKNGETIAGAIYDVMRDVVYSSEKGGGAFADSEKIFVGENDKLLHSVLVTGFPYNVADVEDFIFENFENFTRKSRGIRRLGSAAIDLCYVAKGVFDGYWETQLHPWDLCAGKLIVEEAGGIVTDFKGNEIDIYSNQVLAANKFIHKRMKEIIKTK